MIVGHELSVRDSPSQRESRMMNPAEPTDPRVERDQLQLRRLESWIGVVKVGIGTGLVGITVAILNHQIQTRTVEVEELQQLGQFVEHALDEDLAVRRRFARYFAAVTTSDRLRERWQDYVRTVEEEWEQLEEVIAAARDTLQLSLDSVAALERRLARLDAGGVPLQSIAVGRFDPERTAFCAAWGQLQVPGGEIPQSGSIMSLSCRTGVLVSRRLLSVEELTRIGIEGVTPMEEVPISTPSLSITLGGVRMGTVR
jgi:hypothetical protein